MLQFQNSSRENKYECYQLASSWNLTPNGSATGSDLITTSSCISCIKMLFGEDAADSTTDSPLVLPQNWGNNHAAYLTSWIAPGKMTHAIRVELEMHQNIGEQAQQAQADQDHDNSEEESDDEVAVLEMAGRRSGRRR